jgi:hypothetical protein
VLIDSNKQDIVQILESTKKGVQSGSVSVKDVDKSLSQIDETLSLLPVFIEKISTFNHYRSDIENKLSTFDTEQLRHKESILNTHQGDKSSLESKIRTAEKESIDAIAFIPKSVRTLESILNQISAVQYTVKSE